MIIPTKKLQVFLNDFFTRGAIGSFAGATWRFPAFCAFVDGQNAWVIGADAESDHDARKVSFDTAEASHANPRLAEWIVLRKGGKRVLGFTLLEESEGERRPIWQEQIREAFMRPHFQEWAMQRMRALSGKE